MNKKVLSVLLTVVMAVTMLTAMCPGVLAAQTVNLVVGNTYTNEVLTPVTGSGLGLKSLDAANPGVVSSTSKTSNGITVNASLSGDGNTISFTYSGTPEAAGTVSFEIPYYAGGGIENPENYVVTFNIIALLVETPVDPPADTVIEAQMPVLSTTEPSSSQITKKQTDDAVTFKVEATGNGEISYRWRVDGTEVTSGSIFTIVPEDMTVDVHTVECVVSNTIEDTSKHTTVKWTVTIEEGDAPKITSQATSAKIDGTGTASFVVTAEGDDLKYQWYMISGSKKEAVVDGVYGAIVYAGAATNTLTVKCTMAPKDASTKFVCEVTAGNGLMTATEEYSLKITEDPNAGKVQKIEIIRKPDKTDYVVGETLDEDGMKIKVVTGKDEEEITTGFVCSPAFLDEEGTQTITVSYGGKTATFTVTVASAPHEHEWSEWTVDNSTPIKVYRACIAGDDCTAREVLSKDTFIVQYPTIAAELGLTMGSNNAGTNNSGTDESAGNTNTGGAGNTGNAGTTGETENTDEKDPGTSENGSDKDKNEKKSGNGILWAIIIIAVILLAGVIFYYFKIYRKPYKKPTNNNKK